MTGAVIIGLTVGFTAGFIAARILDCPRETMTEIVVPPEHLRDPAMLLQIWLGEDD